MHLAGEADAGNVLGSHTGTLQRLRNRDATGAPPIFRMLLGPADLRRSKGSVLFGSRRDDAAPLVEDQRPRSTCADVNAESKNLRLLYLSGLAVAGKGFYSNALGDNCSVKGAR
jgi:hypothetical protein